jgi:putative peptide zinc metalloprotease protein
MSDVVRWRLRPDLVWSTIHLGGCLTHVARDPVSGRFFHFDPRERSILNLLDGRRPPADVLHTARSLRPDEVLATDSLLGFVAEARRNGLVLLEGGAVQRKPLKRPTASRSLSSFKIPLFNPAAAVTWLKPLSRMFFSRAALQLWLSLVVSSVVLLVTRFDDAGARLPAAQAWATPSMLAVILVVLGLCKVVHELAHATAAIRYGAPVEECGVMLFYLLPCFYCDVSNAWLLPSPRQRILISAAGMLAELGLAAMATWMWWFSWPGPVQSICLTVMVTCSVNTLLLNGNPLMRFDGYFVLVDLLGLPNLADRARTWWTKTWERVVYGLPGHVDLTGQGIVLALYGAASFVYRWLVLAGIIWAVHRLFDANGAEAVSSTFAVVVIAGAAVAMGRAAIRPLTDRSTRRLLPRRRAFTGALVLMGLALACLLAPLPRSIEAPFLVEPVDADPVYVQTTGQLVSIVPVGTHVRTGDEIARLENLETLKKAQELESQRAAVERRLESARLRRTTNPEASREIPTLIESLAALDSRLTLARQDVQKLRVIAPCDGVVLSPPNIPGVARGKHEPRQWQGDPFDVANLGCTLTPGTHLASIDRSTGRRAVAYVSQRRIDRVVVGQAVRLALEGSAANPLTGVVEELSPAPVEVLPRELVATHRLPLRPLAATPGVPLEPTYQVRVRIIDGPTNLPVALGGTARITVPSASAVSQLIDLATETFRIDW